MGIECSNVSFDLNFEMLWPTLLVRHLSDNNSGWQIAQLACPLDGFCAEMADCKFFYEARQVIPRRRHGPNSLKGKMYGFCPLTALGALKNTRQPLSSEKGGKQGGGRVSLEVEERRHEMLREYRRLQPQSASAGIMVDHFWSDW
jgi:hypothetical protein